MLSYDFLDPKKVENFTESDTADVNALLRQLTRSAKPITRGEIIYVAHHSKFLIARNDEGRIKGIATLCPIAKPTGADGIIEDVVVDVSLRGQHVGETLVLALIKQATELPIRRLELTSHPTRVAANKLYQKLGFQLRETNCYILTL
jgi:N-acetylglutamate synthase-like GNAT family acetyltransferase